MLFAPLRKGSVSVTTNPFDDDDASFHVLINEEGQYSLWPTFRDTPEGWSVVHEEASRKSCLYYIEQAWTDMRPNSLKAETAG
jgi:MbtH protein